jgi:hypothetical protein
LHGKIVQISALVLLENSMSSTPPGISGPFAAQLDLVSAQLEHSRRAQARALRWGIFTSCCGGTAILFATRSGNLTMWAAICLLLVQLVCVARMWRAQRRLAALRGREAP